MHLSSSDSDGLYSILHPAPPPRLQIALGTLFMLHFYLFPPLSFHSPFLFSCLALDLSTIFTPASLPLDVHSSSSALDVLTSCIYFPRLARPPRPNIVLSTILILHTHPTLPSFPLLPFDSIFHFCCLALDLSTIFALAPLPLVLAKAAAAAVFARVPPPLVLADPAAAVFALVPLPLVLAEAAAAAVFAPAPLPLGFTEAAAATDFTRAPPPLVPAEAATAAVFTRAHLPLVRSQWKDCGGGSICEH